MSQIDLREQFPTLGPIVRWVIAAVIRAAVAIKALACLSVWPRIAKWAGRIIARVFLRTWRWAVAFVVLVAIIHSAATYYQFRRLRAELSKIEAAGGCTSFRQIVEVSIPDSENGALVYEKAFKRIIESQKAALDRSLASLRQNEFYRHTTIESPGAFDLIEQAEKMPKCHFKVALDRDGFPDYFYRWWESMAKVLESDALGRAQNGDVAGSCRSIGLLVGLQRSLESGRDYGSWQMRERFVMDAARALTRLAEQAKLSEPQAKRLADEFAAVDLAPGLSTAMSGEFARLHAWFVYVRKYGAQAAECLCDVNCGIQDMLRYTYLARPWSYAEERHLLQSMEYLIPMLSRPYREIGEDQWLYLDTKAASAGHVSYNIAVPFGEAHFTLDSSRAVTRGSRIFLALLAYRDRFGSCPAALDDLKKLGWKLDLEDPFSGKEFVYRRTGDEFVLYSVGRDLQDDGGNGRYVTDPIGQPAVKGPCDDIVWRLDFLHRPCRPLPVPPGFGPPVPLPMPMPAPSGPPAYPPPA